MFLLATAVVFMLVIGMYQTSLTHKRRKEEEEECRVLVLAGGGDHGAFQAGAVKALVEFTKAQWNIVSGTSIGGINAGLFSQSKMADDDLGVNYLYNFWSTMTRSDFYVNWEFGMVEGFFFEMSLFDSSVAVTKTIKEYFDDQLFRESDRMTYFGTTNLATGEFESINYTFSDIGIAAAASSAIPGLFLPIQIGDQWYVDGGLSSNAPVSKPIEICKQYFPGRKVIVDLVSCMQRIKKPEIIQKDLVTPFILISSLIGVANNLMINDLQYAKTAFPDATINVYEPLEFIYTWLIDFNHDQMMKMLDQGYNDTKKQILGM